MIGSTLSHYQILDELGRGGMGIVYKARDTKLDRTVAIKVLPSAALASDDDRARFYREAKAAAALTHAHIAIIHAVDEAVPEGAPNGTEPSPFIAMEFIDGETLEARIARGPFQLDEAVRIAREVASALQLAHENEIVHRDIKSANVMLTAEGSAKVLDFGLAQTSQSTKLTRLGSTLGTVAYMSPEQARAEAVDNRADLWSLGVVLYEMTAGRLPFSTEYEQAAVYSILNEDPEPLTALRTGVPMELERIVFKLLAKDADSRYQSATDLIVDLKAVDVSGSGVRPSTMRTTAIAPVPETSATAASPTTSGGVRSFLQVAPWILFSAAVVALLWLMQSGGSSESEWQPTTKRFAQDIPLSGTLIAVDISPDGSKIAYASDFVRILDLETGSIREMPETGTPVHVEYSPDGKWLLLTQATGIARISVDGGSAVDVQATSEGGPRATWITDDVIVYEDEQGIFRKSLLTGEVSRVVVPDSSVGEFDIDWPSALPDGKTIVATLEYRDEDSRIGFWDTETGKRKALLDYPGYRVQWVDAGYLLFEMRETAMVLPFDPTTLEQTGPLVPVAAEARAEGISVSHEGTLVFAGTDIGVRTASRPIMPIKVIPRGRVTRLGFPPDYYRDLELSPDGTRAVTVIQYSADPGGGQDVWVLDLNNGTRRQITQGGVSDHPTWLPSGDSLLYVSTTRGAADVMIVPANRAGASRILIPGEAPSRGEQDVSPDGSLYAVVSGYSTAIDVLSALSVTPIGNRGARRMLTDGNTNPRSPEFSPDSRYVVYEDRGRILVQPVNDSQRIPITVWSAEMTLPHWSPDGTRIYAIAPDGTPHATPVQLKPDFAVTGASHIVANWPVAGARLFDVFPDGRAFILPAADNLPSKEINRQEAESSATLHFVVNWFNELTSQ